MAFEGLSEKLNATFKRLRGKGRLTENVQAVFMTGGIWSIACTSGLQGYRWEPVS